MRKLLAVLLFALSAPLAAQDYMAKSTRTEVTPEPGKALVIFVRSSFVVGAYSAPVVEVGAGGDDKLVGILSMYSKVAYQAEPGERMFMSTPFGGGSALIVRGKLQAGKTYYVLVKPNWGFAPSFTLVPARNDPAAEVRVDSAELAGWLKGTEFYEPTQLAPGYISGNRQSLDAKKAEALKSWNAMPEAEKAKYTLLESDGK